MAAALWTDPELEAGVTLYGVVTVVDARNIRRQLAAPPAAAAAAAAGTTNEAQQQIAYADVILLNKVPIGPERPPVWSATRWKLDWQRRC